MEKQLRELSEKAYCDYIAQMRRPECLGHEQKLKEGKFGEAELAAHRTACELLGRHRAFAEAAAIADSRPEPPVSPLSEEQVRAVRLAKETIEGWAEDVHGKVYVHKDVVLKALNAALGSVEGQGASQQGVSGDDYDATERRRARDLVTVVMSVVSGAPADNLPDDCAAIVKHWMEGLNISLKSRAAQPAAAPAESGSREEEK